jgi:hypothetical protein
MMAWAEKDRFVGRKVGGRLRLGLDGFVASLGDT